MYELPRWQNVAACLVWPDRIYQEKLERLYGSRIVIPCYKTIEKLRYLVKNGDLSLKTVNVIRDRGEDEIITASELRRAINSGMVYPNRLSDSEFRDLMLVLDPLHTNLIKVNDYLKLLAKDENRNFEDRVEGVTADSIKRSQPLTLMEIDNRLRNRVKSQIDELMKTFISYDFENKGLIPKQLARYLIHKHCLPLSDTQFEQIWKTFPGKDGNQLHYLTFLEEFGDAGPSIHNKRQLVSCKVPHIIKNHFQSPAMDLRITTVHGSRSTPTRSPKTSAEITSKKLDSNETDWENWFCKCVETKWRDIILKCRQTDPKRSGRIATESLKEILNGCGIPIHHHAIQDLLELRYGLFDEEVVNYWNFIRKCIVPQKGHYGIEGCQLPNINSPELQPYEKKKPDYMSIPMEAAWINIPAPPNYDLLLKKLVDMAWHDILKKCRLIDTKETGNITSEQFFRVLANCGIPLHNKNIGELIRRVYGGKKGKINYWQFLRRCCLDDDKILDNIHINRILLRMRAQVQFHFRALREKMVERDSKKIGLIDLVEFRKILYDFAIIMSDEEFLLLAKYFDPVRSGFIPYASFLQSFGHPGFV